MDYLGQDEIILITCDDGDVIGYRTEEIQRVLDKQNEVSEDENEVKIEEPVRTFLHRNVGASAWGLAIHREARMIAISANTEKVTVIAYAIAQPDDNSDNTSLSSGSEQDDCSDEEDPRDFPSPRRQDHVIVLSARHNVPSVSFNNSGDDPSGRWLSSCSIVGEALIWDLHSPAKPVRTIRLGFCASTKDPTMAPKLRPGTCACLRPSTVPHAIWSTMFLTAETAYEDSSLQDASPRQDHPLPYIKDLSDCKHRFSVRRSSSPPTASSNEATSDNSDAHEMDISETESAISDDDWNSSSSFSESSGNEQLDQSIGSEMDADENPESDQQYTDPAQLSLDAPSVDNTQPPPPLPSGNAINAFGPWYQPTNQTFSIDLTNGASNLTAALAHMNQTPIVDSDNEDSDSDDDLFVSTSAQAHMAFVNAIQPARAYCEIITAFTLARQVHSRHSILLYRL